MSVNPLPQRQSAMPVMILHTTPTTIRLRYTSMPMSTSRLLKKSAPIEYVSFPPARMGLSGQNGAPFAM